MPSVGRIVHYVSYGTPGGEYTSQCRVAVIAAVRDQEDDDAQDEVVDLCVLNPTGLFFNVCPHEESTEGGGHNGGTWHWPERVP
jgi:hypothetical protein